MRTLILIAICAACVGLAVGECRDRTDRGKVFQHGTVGLVVGLVLWKFLVYAGMFDHW
ncbi:MAG: hypothetical protein ABIQ12_10205 [Opitutaceae bacterium]